jgi:LL-diaminopimelate aminotransferase
LYSPEGRKQCRALVDHYMGNASLLRAACEKSKLKVFGGENAPYIWVKTPSGLTSWQMFDRMLTEAQVVVTPGSGFGAQGEGYMRISAFNSRENAEEAGRRLQSLG